MASPGLLAEEHLASNSAPSSSNAPASGSPSSHLADSDRASKIDRPWTYRLWLHILLLALTLATTTMVGTRYAFNFRRGQTPIVSDADIFPFRWVWEHLSTISSGLPFSATLLAILLAHEFGHYFACRYYGVACSLPYLIPAPTLSGTGGAVIRLKSRVETRAALIVIGAAGPIAGFVIACGTTLAGLLLSTPVHGPQPSPILNFHAPLLMTFFEAILHRRDPAVPPLLWMVPHPILLASWVGLLITSINLLPAGQLDGGHIVYALSARAHRYSSHLTILALLVLGATEWLGWLLWALLLMLPAMRHPRPARQEPLDRWHYVLAPICLLIFLFTLTLQPFSGGSLADLIGNSVSPSFLR